MSPNPRILTVPRLQSRRGGCLAKCFVLFVLFSLFLVACWIFVLPPALCRVVESRTGYKVEVSSLTLNPFTARLAVEGLVIANPPADFAQPDFVTVRSFRGDAELFSLFTDRPVLEEAVVDIESVTLVRNARGESNGVLFGRRLQGPPSGEPAVEPAADEPAPREQAATGSPRREFLIRKLHLRLNKVVLIDATGAKPSSRDFNIAFDHTYQNVTTPAEIMTPILSHIAVNGRAVGDFLGEMGKKTGDAAKKAGESIKDIFKSIKEKVGK